MKEKWARKIGVIGIVIGSVGIASAMIQGATSDSNKYATIQEVKDMLTSQKLQSSQMLQLYPVGSVYISTSGTNPSSLFGGTWVAWGSGRVPVGVNTGDGNFNTVEKTGGTATETLSVSQMPSHTHTFTGRAVTSGGNSVTPSASFTGKAVNTGNQSTGHTHSVSLTTSENGKHTHQQSNQGWYNLPGNPSSWWTNYNASGVNWLNSASQGVTAPITTENGAHTHSVSGNTGGISANHTHSVTAAGSVSLANTSHTHSVTAVGSNSSTGGGAAHNNLQPYITCYMWKRTA